MRHYLYRHIRNDKNVPFYIGIGTKQKYNWSTWEYEYNRAYSKYHRGVLWSNIVKKIGGDYSVEILMESDDYGFIKDKEREFIKLYGRIDNKTGILSNLTDGGEGVIGAIRTNEWRENISKSQAGKPKYKLRGLKRSEETKRKSSESQKGRKLTEEHKTKIREKRRFQVIAPEVIEKLRISNIGRKDTDEIKKCKSEAAKKRGVSQAFRDIGKKKVVQYSITGEFISEYESAAEASRQTGIHVMTITRQCKKAVKKINMWVKFIWKWKEEEKTK